MSKYYFYNNEKGRHECIEAPSVEVAIKLFNTEELFPEKFVEESYIIEKTYLDLYQVTIKGLHYSYTFKNNPRIFIYEYIEKEREYKKIKSILLESCLNYKFEDISVSNKMLLGSDNKVETSIQVRQEEHLALVGDKSKLASMNKTELRTIVNAIDKMKLEMERKTRDLQATIYAIEKELDQKRELLYYYETYLGIKEEIHTLLSGENTDESIPLTLYQQMLYMDEEVGIWENGGIDYGSIEKFDEWIKINYDKFLYEPKSICIFRVRRDFKSYTGDYNSDRFGQDDNFKTYYLIRNGENLYRIYSSVYIKQRLFPKTKEYEEIINSANDQDRLDKHLEQLHKDYFVGLLYIQGLLDRTTILGISLSNKVDLIRNKFTEEQVKLIRDDEQNMWIGNGRPSWNQFLAENEKTITVGSRVAILADRWCVDDKSRKRTEWISSIDFSEIYHVNQIAKETMYSSAHLKVLYMPRGDTTVYSARDGYKEREKRVSYKLYWSEVINIDTITSEECDYYLKNRNEREHYLKLIPLLIRTKLFKAKEEKLESEFIKYLQTQVKNPIEEILEAINWWKMKVKFKRGLMVDDAKALRMITKKLKEMK